MAQEKWEIYGGAGVDDADFQFGCSACLSGWRATAPVPVPALFASRTTHIDISHSVSRRRRSGRPAAPVQHELASPLATDSDV